MKIIDEDKINNFVDIILRSKRQYVFANRGSFSLAHFMYFRLKIIFPKMILINNFDGGIIDYIKDMSTDDVLLTVCFPRFYYGTIDFAKQAKKQGIKVLSITNNRTSPMYQISDLCLFAPLVGVSYNNSLVAPLSLINTIIF